MRQKLARRKENCWFKRQSSKEVLHILLEQSWESFVPAYLVPFVRFLISSKLGEGKR